MDKTRVHESLSWKLSHVGIIVKDIEKAIEYYQSLGIGPFERINLTPIDVKVYGKSADDVKLRARAARVGQVQYELLQPVSGESVQMEFLKSKGEGISHLGFFVDDIDKEVAKMVEQGFKVISNGKFVGGGGFAYFDTDKVGGVQFELIQWPPE